MWVPCRSALERESRIAAQLAPLATVGFKPNLAKKPFSLASTTGEQSVSAMMPSLTSGCSGESSAYTPPTQRNGTPESSDPATEARIPARKNPRRPTCN